MAYTIYKRVQVLSIEQKEVQRQLRPQEIADPARRRDNYTVSVARFEGVSHSATFSDFEKEIQTGHNVSIAVSDKRDVIAVVNHTTGQSSGLSYFSMKFSDIFGILFYISIPTTICLGIAWKMRSTIKYHDDAWIPVAIAAVIAIAIARGLNKEFIESRKALQELR